MSTTKNHASGGAENVTEVGERIADDSAGSSSGETAAAWERVRRGLNEICQAPEFMRGRASGVRLFVMALRDMCEDIGAHITEDSYDQAMQKLRAGFLRAQRLEQDQTRAEAEAWVVAEWKAHAGLHMHNKSRFARRYETRLKDERGMTVTQRTIKERWLKDI